MNIEQFAEQYHVKTKRDECGDTILAGKVWRSQPKDGYGHQIFDNGGGRFGLFLSFEVDNGHEIGGSGKSTKWVNAQRKLKAAGFIIKQNGLNQVKRVAVRYRRTTKCRPSQLSPS